MKRDMDLIRKLLLLIEEQGHDKIRWIENVEIEGYTEQQISQHVWLLADGGYIEAIDLSNMSRIAHRPRCLTWRGHEFLEAIRDKDIWVQTIDTAKAGGTATIAAIIQIATALAQKKIEKLLGMAD